MSNARMALCVPQLNGKREASRLCRPTKRVGRPIFGRGSRLVATASAEGNVNPNGRSHEPRPRRPAHTHRSASRLLTTAATRPVRVKGCPATEAVLTAGVPQIADAMLHRASRQDRATERTRCRGSALRAEWSAWRESRQPTDREAMTGQVPS
jgi:hypothetical protein